MQTGASALSKEGFPDGSAVNNPPAKQDTPVRSLGQERNVNPLQYSCLENPMEGGAWQATVHGVTKSQT